MRVISLFAGAGGLDLGFTWAGFDVIWANEFDKTIWETYEENHDGILNRKDIRKLQISEIPKDIDGIIGGPPCQSWSLAGKMRGSNDERGKLFFEYLRILKATKPKFFVVENVKGIVSKAHIEEFQNILSLFSEAGYKNFYSVLNSYDFEVPQTRERVFIVGFREDLNLDFRFPEKSSQKRNLRDVLNLETAKPFQKEKPHHWNHEYLESGFSSIFMSRNRIRNFDEPSFTIQASGRQAPIHPDSPKMVKIGKDKWKFEKEEGIRRLSIRECARVQTFPDEFKFFYKNVNDGYKMVGNAVPPKLAQKIGEQIQNSFKREIFGETGNIKLSSRMEEECNLFTISL